MNFDARVDVHANANIVCKQGLKHGLKLSIVSNKIWNFESGPGQMTLLTEFLHKLSKGKGINKGGMFTILDL